MSAEGYIILFLFFLGSIIAGRIGWDLATDHWNKQLTDELRKEASEKFEKQFFNEFVKRYEIAVEERALEIAEKIIDEYEKEKENEDSGSH